MTACREWSSDSGGESQELRHKRERRSYADLGEKPDPTTAARTKASRERQRRERLNDRSGTCPSMLRALAKPNCGKASHKTSKSKLGPTATMSHMPDHMVSPALNPSNNNHSCLLESVFTADIDNLGVFNY